MTSTILAAYTKGTRAWFPDKGGPDVMPMGSVARAHRGFPTKNADTANCADCDHADEAWVSAQLESTEIVDGGAVTLKFVDEQGRVSTAWHGSSLSGRVVVVVAQLTLVNPGPHILFHRARARKGQL